MKSSDEAGRARAEAEFPGKEYLLAPEPYALGEKEGEELDKLGYRLNLFIRACNLLYHLSAAGKQPGWIAAYLDRGKSREWIEQGRRKDLREALPPVFSPEIILTETGWKIVGLDLAPSRIGLAAWLSERYAGIGSEVIGGERGIIEGFTRILPDGRIAVAEEAVDRRVEMEWLAGRMNTGSPDGMRWEVTGTEISGDLQKNIYRAFCLRDLSKLPNAREWMERPSVTPPIKPFLEERMWFALFWMRPLHAFWRRELGERQFLQLQKVIPYTWILDPTPLPRHAVIPRLEIHEWLEAGRINAQNESFVLKKSGCLGERRAMLLHADAAAEWKAEIAGALEEFENGPCILQEYCEGNTGEHAYQDADGKEAGIMRGHAHLRPCYFIMDGKAELKGAYAAIFPSEEKLPRGTDGAVLTALSFNKP